MSGPADSPVDLDAEMGELWRSLGAAPPGRARAVLFTAAAPAEGVSTIAREFAFWAARRASRRVWLVDMDLDLSPQASIIAAQSARYGQLGPPSVASPNGAVFFAVEPPLRRPDGRPWPENRYLAAQAVGSHALWVTSFRRETLRANQSVRIAPAGEYWQALRRHSDLIVVDAPSLQRSDAALIQARFMDEIVLVVAADQPDIAAPARLREALEAAGGRVSGLFHNREAIEVPKFLSA
ncbi:MAG: transcriptional regulator, partial [Caulobacteraceae bacterium]